jgi:hypothetical protein
MYPLDFAGLKKGDEFDHVQLLAIVGLKDSPPAQRIAFLKLKGLIEKKRPDLPVVRLTGDGRDRFMLRILEDWEAAEWTHHRCAIGARTLGRGLRREAAVDPTRLDEAQRKSWEHGLSQDARMYFALRKARHQIETVDQERVWKMVGQPLKDTRRADALERARLRAQKQLPEAEGHANG